MPELHTLLATDDGEAHEVSQTDPVYCLHAKEGIGRLSRIPFDDPCDPICFQYEYLSCLWQCCRRLEVQEAPYKERYDEPATQAPPLLGSSMTSFCSAIYIINTLRI